MLTSSEETWARTFFTAVVAVVVPPFKTNVKLQNEKTCYESMLVLHKRKISTGLAWAKAWSTPHTEANKKCLLTRGMEEHLPYQA